LRAEDQSLAIQVKRISPSDDSAGVVHYGDASHVLIDDWRLIADHAFPLHRPGKHVPLMQEHFLLQAAWLGAAISRLLSRRK
jgi:hypothetical protein